MPIQKVPFQEPAPEEATEIIIYGDKIDLKTKKYKDSNHIKVFQTYNKKEMINIITGEIKPKKQKENKEEGKVSAYMHEVNNITEENLLGTLDRGMLIQLKLNEEMTNTQALLIWKNYKDKILRRLPKGTNWIRVLIYHKENTPEYDFWIIAPEPITIDEATIKALWEDGTRTVEVITPITKKVLEEKAQYYKKSSTRMELYKTHEQILGTSNGIKGTKIKNANHETAKKHCRGYRRIFKTCKRQTETIDNLEQEVQFYTYETYEKYKRKIQLKITKDKRYSRKKSAPRTTTGAINEVKEKQKKKAYKVIKQEVQEKLAEIGLEVQEKINKMKGR